MSVRILIGEYDGTTPAAAMVNGATGWMIGPLFEGPDAYEQIEAFLSWLRSHDELATRLVMDANLNLGYALTFGQGGDDPRHWSDAALDLIVKHWRSEHLDEDGYLCVSDEQVEIERDAEDDLP